MDAPEGRHDWVEDLCQGPVKVCSRCPDVWWFWACSQEPTTACVPIEDVTIDYAATQGEVA